MDQSQARQGTGLERRLTEHNHQSKTLNVEANGDHVRRNRAVQPAGRVPHIVAAGRLRSKTPCTCADRIWRRIRGDAAHAKPASPGGKSPCTCTNIAGGSSAAPRSHAWRRSADARITPQPAARAAARRSRASAPQENPMLLYELRQRRICGATNPCQAAQTAPGTVRCLRPSSLAPRVTLSTAAKRDIRETPPASACTHRLSRHVSPSPLPPNETLVRRRRLPNAPHGAPHRTCAFRPVRHRFA